MSLMTLERYLYGPRGHHGEPAKAPGISHLDLVVRVLSGVRRSVFRGSAFADLSERVEAVRKALVVESNSVSVEESANRLEALLEEFRTRVGEIGHQQAADFRRIIEILNETFTHLHNGRDNTTALMTHLEAGLGRASKIDDLPSLRTHLAKMLEFVHTDGKRERLEQDVGLDRLGNHIRETYAACSRLGARIPKRSEAMEELRLMLLTPETKPHVGLFQADALNSVAARYGKEVSAVLLEELGRKHLAPLVPEGKLYQWSGSSLLLLWNHTSVDSPPTDLFSTVKSFEHRAFVGGRVACFKLTVKSVVVRAAGSFEDVIYQLDRFSTGD